MSGSETPSPVPDPVPRRRPVHPHWTARREIVELAILFLAIGTSGLFTEFLGQRHHGWLTLMGFGALLAVSSSLHWWWKAHGPGRPAGIPLAGPAGTRANPAPEPEGPVLYRIRAVVRDTPGSLAAVCERLAALDVNILGLQVHPLATGVVDEFLVAAPPEVDPGQLAAAVTHGGAADPRIDPARATDLTDAPARALLLAGRLAAGTAAPALVLHDLFGDCTVTWHAEPVAEGSCQDTTMILPDPDGGSLWVARPGLAFTPTEFARAQALAALCFELRRVRLSA